ncbi:c-type cytochrome biogenesis protein CcsB [Falsarthrobacter nasiphocae]|uniref:Cytochrome c-type biogenesis protein CcsB n=1 Tax=Falsarthrobacter nasiphocae TaxID=189863 RepID=A0AAE3YHH2_9MICC|nr:c-type cytochrome biogenesis protein CcsB [Falsarthrobacter nasiphocae]MDR6892377.1 cytochrome c-type biogenesis protein CcsB [Falsarthrobacter nasiphocae]
MIAPVNEQLGQLAGDLVYFAAATYAVAFILFTLDFARAAAAKPAAAKAAGTASERTVSGARRPAMASAGAGGSSEDWFEDGEARENAASTPGARASGRADDELFADAEMEYDSSRVRPQGRAAVAIMVIAALIHGTAVVMRGVAAHRVPWGNMYEFCTTGAFIVAAVFLLVLVRRDLRFLGAFVTGLVTLMLCAAAIGFPTPVGNLVPALQSYWIVIHVSIAVLSSALFTLTFAMAVLQLFQARRTARIEATGVDPMPVLSRVPSAASLENFAYRINIIAFIFWTFTLIAGAIWANEAWGRYWGWDPKEVWTFIIWVVYAAYLHARATRGWTGTRAAWLSIAGYACVIFNFAVVNVVFNSIHSYSGLK